MKVVHITTYNYGGASIAAKRISEALCRAGADSKVISMKEIQAYNRTRISRLLRKITYHFIDRFERKFHFEGYFNFDLKGLDLTKVPEISSADVINLHWVGDGLVSNRSLKQLKKINKPIVWTLHDMHPFTGGCHYDGDCGRYRELCGKCPKLKSAAENDYTSRNLKKKKAIIERLNVTVVGCSRWITECAKQSAVFKNKECITIHNCIDEEQFYPVDKQLARKALALPDDGRKIILFGAIAPTGDKRKGYQHLVDALKLLNPAEYCCCVFGGYVDTDISLSIISVGEVSDTITLRLLYSAADVFVAPSIQENLANTVVESLTCGTPVVAFNIGGMPDMINHKKNGYLAKPFDAADFSNGIEFSAMTNLIINEKRYSFIETSKQYIKLYNKICRKSTLS